MEKKSSKLVSLVKPIKEEVEARQFDDNNLRELIKKIGGLIPDLSEMIGHSIIYCDICGEVCFAINTQVAYNGEYWTCRKCSEAFVFCDKCNTNVLTADLTSSSHTHVEFLGAGKIVFPEENPVAAYNADILTSPGKGKGFFRAKQEVDVYKRRVKNGSTYPDNVFRYFGVELEVEKIPAAPPDLNARTEKLLGKDFVMLKHDGSLSRRGKGGFEIVSMPATMAYHKSGAWTSFFKELSSFFLSNPTTTGLHVHIGRNTITPGQMGKLLLFVNSKDNREFVFGIANRNLQKASPNGRLYAGVREWKASDLLRLKQHQAECPWHPANKNNFNFYAVANGIIKTDPWGNPVIVNLTGGPSTVRQTCKCPEGRYDIDHYEAVNLRTQRPTIELRIFRGLVDENYLYACLEFSDALIDFCGITKPSDLLYRNFLDYVIDNRGRHRYLYQMLVNQCWIDPPTTKKHIQAPQIPAYGIYA